MDNGFGKVIGIAAGVVAFFVASYAVQNLFSGPSYGSKDKLYKDPAGQFQVEMPENYKFKLGSQRVPIKGMAPLKIKTYMAEGRSNIKLFGIAITKVSVKKIRRGRSNKQIAIDAINGSFSGMGGKASKITTVKRQGKKVYRGIGQCRYKGHDLWAITEIWMYSTGYYQVMVVGDSKKVYTDKRGENFLKTFKVLSKTSRKKTK